MLSLTRIIKYNMIMCLNSMGESNVFKLSFCLVSSNVRGWVWFNSHYICHSYNLLYKTFMFFNMNYFLISSANSNQAMWYSQVINQKKIYCLYFIFIPWLFIKGWCFSLLLYIRTCSLLERWAFWFQRHLKRSPRMWTCSQMLKCFDAFPFLFFSFFLLRFSRINLMGESSDTVNY